MGPTDGDGDIVSRAIERLDDTIAWYENDGHLPTLRGRQPTSPHSAGNDGTNDIHVRAMDMDNDGQRH